MMIRALALLWLASPAIAWTAPTSRRDVMNIAAATILASPAVANAMEACPPKAQNCVTATWTPPSGTSKKDSVLSVRAVIDGYPQEGQAKVDGGGWSIAEDALDASGTGRVEYKSSGKGNFAKFFNGGKPFTDDLLIEVGDDGKVQLKSSSRVGESDFGVNKVCIYCISCALGDLVCSIAVSCLNTLSLLSFLTLLGSCRFPLKLNQSTRLGCCYQVALLIK